MAHPQVIGGGAGHPLAILGPLDGGDGIAQEDHHQAHHQFRHRLCVAARRTQHRHAGLGAGIHLDIGRRGTAVSDKAELIISIQDLGSDPIQLSDQHIRLYPEQIFQHLILIEPLSVAGPGLIDHFVKHRPQFLQAPLRIRRAYINFLKAHSFLYISLLNRTLWLPCQSTGPAHRAHTRPCP